MSWKMALSHAFQEFVALFFPRLGDQIDWTTRPRFRDKELVALGFGDDAGGLVADKLIEVRLRAGGMQWVLIHVEVQAQRDASLAHLRTQQARHDPDALYAAKWQLTKLLYQHGWHKERIIVLFKVKKAVNKAVNKAVSWGWSKAAGGGVGFVGAATRPAVWAAAENRAEQAGEGEPRAAGGMERYAFGGGVAAAGV